MSEDTVVELIKSERDKIEDILRDIYANCEGDLGIESYSGALYLIMARLDSVYAKAYEEGFDSGYQSVLEDISAQITGEEYDEV